MSRAALATKSGLASTNLAPHGFCCSSKPSTSRPMSSDVGAEVLVAAVLLVAALCPAGWRSRLRPDTGDCPLEPVLASNLQHQCQLEPWETRWDSELVR